MNKEQIEKKIAELQKKLISEEYDKPREYSKCSKGYQNYLRKEIRKKYNIEEHGYLTSSLASLAFSSIYKNPNFKDLTQKERKETYAYDSSVRTIYKNEDLYFKAYEKICKCVSEIIQMGVDHG